jgi:hypothetical protein
MRSIGLQILWSDGRNKNQEGSNGVSALISVLCARADAGVVSYHFAPALLLLTDRVFVNETLRPDGTVNVSRSQIVNAATDIIRFFSLTFTDRLQQQRFLNQE